MNITMENAKGLIYDVLKANLVPFIQGPPGVGKSDLGKTIASENNLKLIDIRLSQMDPADLNGFPFMQQDRQRAGYVPMDSFPLEGLDEVPDGMNGWLVLLDEFNSAPISVQAAAYKVILDRMVGMHKLHKKVWMIAAGNQATDRAIVNRISTAMQSRLLHFTMAVDYKAWIKWADKSGIDHRIKSFINFKPDALHRFDPNHNEETFPCPRTWEFTSRLTTMYPEEFPQNKLPLMAAALGEGMARELFAYFKVYGEIPSIDNILDNPATIHLNQEPGIQYALSGLVAHHLSLKNADKLMVFLKRLNIDLQVIALRSAIARNNEIKTAGAVRDWIVANAKEL